jgi:processive 1,2-diacylglycerol beta-glucosyltransferase
MQKKKIFLAMIEAGGGHKSPAQATEEAFNELFPRKFDVIVPDFTKYVGAIELDKTHKKSWQFLLSKPLLSMSAYYFQDIFEDVSKAYVKQWMKEFVEKGCEWFKNNYLDVFVSYHFLNTMVAVEAKKRFNLLFPVVSYLTEPMDAHGMWVLPDTDYKVVSSQIAKMDLIARGFPIEKIVVIPYLVKPSFLKISAKREDIIEDLGLDTNKKTVIISSGAEGLGKVESFSMEIIKKNLPVNLIVVCAKNKELKEKLDKFKESYHGDTNIIVKGYVTNMNELISVSDICAVKASPGSTFEALFLNKIVIHTQYVTPSEKANTDYILREQIGFYTPTKMGFINTVKSLVENQVLYDEYRERIKAQGFKTGAYDMAKFIANLAVGRTL